MPATRTRWQAIKEQYVDNDMLLFALDRHFQQLLLANIDLLQYRATYRTDNYDYSDWDSLQTVVDGGIHGLISPMDLTDLIQYIDEIEALLTAIKNKDACCALPDGVQVQPVPDEPLSSHTSDGEDYPDTYAGVTMTSANEYHLYLCGAANKLADNLVIQSQQLADYASVGLLTVTVVASIYLTVVTGGAALPISAVLLLQLLETLKDGWTSGILDSSISDLETNKSLIICAALQNNPAVLSAAIEAIVTPAAWSIFYSWLNYNNMVAALFTGTVNGENITVSPTDEPCACAPVVYDYDETFTFDSALTTWLPNTYATWNAKDGGCVRLAAQNNDGGLWLQAYAFTTLTGITRPATLDHKILSFDYWFDLSGSDPTEWGITVYDDTTNKTTVYSHLYTPQDSWQHVVIDLSTLTGRAVTTANPGVNLIYFWLNRYSTTSGGTEYLYLDNIRIAGNVR